MGLPVGPWLSLRSARNAGTYGIAKIFPTDNKALRLLAPIASMRKRVWPSGLKEIKSQHTPRKIFLLTLPHAWEQTFFRHLIRPRSRFPKFGRRGKAVKIGREAVAVIGYERRTCHWFVCGLGRLGQ